MKKKIKNKLKNFFVIKTGSISIIWPIFIFILIMGIGGARQVIFRSLSINEVKNSMDISGVSALRASVQNDEHRLEDNNKIFDKHKAEQLYYTLLKETFNKQNYIRGYEIREIECNVDEDSWRFDDGKSRKEAYISALVAVKYDCGFFDMNEKFSGMVYNSKDNESHSVQFTGVTNDGLAELLIYSSTRVVFK